eukprot:scaffold106720_cov62-Phaeocystis_antarctica.AAC.5
MSWTAVSWAAVSGTAVSWPSFTAVPAALSSSSRSAGESVISFFHSSVSSSAVGATRAELLAGRCRAAAATESRSAACSARMLPSTKTEEGNRQRLLRWGRSSRRSGGLNPCASTSRSLASIHVHRLALHVLFEHVRVGGRSQLLQRARLDLPYALAGDRHRAADLRERARPAVAQAVAHAQHVRLALRQLAVEEPVEVGAHHQALRVVRRLRLLVRDELLQRRAPCVRLLLGADGRLHRDRRHRAGAVGELHLVHRHAEVRRKLLVRGGPAQPRRQLVPRAPLLVDRVVHVHGQPDRARVVGDRAGDGLPDPPRGVRREAEAALRVELLRRLDQPHASLLDEVLQRQALVHVLLGDRDHQPEIGGYDELLSVLHVLELAPVLLPAARQPDVRGDLVVGHGALHAGIHLLPQRPPLEHLLDAACERGHFLGREQPLRPNVLQVPLHRVVGSGTPWCLEPHRGGWLGGQGGRRWRVGRGAAGPPPLDHAIGWVDDGRANRPLHHRPLWPTL